VYIEPDLTGFLFQSAAFTALLFSIIASYATLQTHEILPSFAVMTGFPKKEGGNRISNRNRISDGNLRFL
jgi:hypothetical protein